MENPNPPAVVGGRLRQHHSKNNFFRFFEVMYEIAAIFPTMTFTRECWDTETSVTVGKSIQKDKIDVAIYESRHS